MTYRSGKTYGHERGLSCSFRQWRADSHCNKVHGYALSVHIEFEADELDHRNWVIDFGGMKAVKQWLEDMFDHKLVVASDDPNLDEFYSMEEFGMADIREMDNVGCEAFAEAVAVFVDRWLLENDHKPRVRLHHVTIREHGANSATFVGEPK